MSGDSTYQGLERLTHMPNSNEPNQGHAIAGQYYYDVLFTGGDISNVTLTDVTINGVTTARTETIVTAAGGYTVQAGDYVVTIKKTVPATTIVTLPASPTTSRSLIIKDGTGNCGTYNITLNGNGKTIDGSATYVMIANYEAVEIIYNGTEWNLIGSYAVNGDVIGAASSTDNAIARFDGATGRVIQNSAVTIADTTGVFAGASIDTAAAANILKVNGTSLTAVTGTGSVVLATSPTVTGISSNTYTSTVATGTAPLTVASTTQVANLNAATSGTATTSTAITVANEASDTTCFPVFTTAATGDLPPKSNTGLIFNSSTGALGATSFSGAGTGLTGTASGLTAGAVTGATFTTALTVDTGTVTLHGNAANTSALTLGAGASSISGANTGDQTITLTGAVTGSGTGSFATTIATPGTLTVATTNSTATAHTHAITSSSAPGAAAYLLATDASGIIGTTGTRIVKGWFADLTVTNTIAGSVTGNAATVTTNANLTGVITSSGNATSIASQTGTGTKFVVDTSPTLVTPVIGAATGTSLNLSGLTASRTVVTDASKNLASSAPNTSQTSPANPTGTTSGSPVMMGLAIPFTPNFSGVVQVTIAGQMANSLTGGVGGGISYGTGTAPINGAAATGTAVGAQFGYNPSVAATTISFSVTAIVTVTVGVAIWIDLTLYRATAAGTASIVNLGATIMEIK